MAYFKTNKQTNRFIEMYFTYHTTCPFTIYNSMIFSILNIFSFLSLLKETPILLAVTSPFLHPISLYPDYSSRQPLTYFLYRFAYSEHFTQMESYNIWSFVSGFFHLKISGFINPVVRVSISFLFTDK